MDGAEYFVKLIFRYFSIKLLHISKMHISRQSEVSKYQDMYVEGIIGEFLLNWLGQLL